MTLISKLQNDPFRFDTPSLGQMIGLLCDELKTWATASTGPRSRRVRICRVRICMAVARMARACAPDSARGTIRRWPATSAPAEHPKAPPTTAFVDPNSRSPERPVLHAGPARKPTVLHGRLLPRGGAGGGIARPLRRAMRARIRAASWPLPASGRTLAFQECRRRVPAAFAGDGLLRSPKLSRRGSARPRTGRDDRISHERSSRPAWSQPS